MSGFSESGFPTRRWAAPDRRDARRAHREFLALHHLLDQLEVLWERDSGRVWLGRRHWLPGRRRGSRPRRGLDGGGGRADARLRGSDRSDGVTAGTRSPSAGCRSAAQARRHVALEATCGCVRASLSTTSPGHRGVGALSMEGLGAPPISTATPTLLPS